MRVFLLPVACVFAMLTPTVVRANQLDQQIEQEQLLPNGRFTEGNGNPAGWTLSGGQGRWVDHQYVEVTGSGTDSNYWRSDPVRLRPGQLYRFAVRARRGSGHGCVIAGPSFANRDYYQVDSHWKWYSHVFRVPDETAAGYIRVGQWQATGAVQFREVFLRPVIAIHRQIQAEGATFLLGEGESTSGRTYSFVGTFSHPGSNYHRPLVRSTAAFNSNRWVFGGASEVVYRFSLPKCRFVEGELSVNVNWYARGGCRLEISTDGQHWHLIGKQEAVGSVGGKVPGELLPASQLLVRLRASEPRSSLQVDRVEFHSKLDRVLPEAIGQTVYADVLERSASLSVVHATLVGDALPNGSVLALRLHNTGNRPVDVRAILERTDHTDVPHIEPAAASVPADGEALLRIRIPLSAPGEHRFRVSLVPEPNGNDAMRMELAITVPEFYRADYGARIANISGPVTVWWCESGWKVARSRPVPSDDSEAVRLEAAKHDFEAAQVVLWPDKPLRRLRVEVSHLEGPRGARITADNIHVLRVYYHFVHHPTDSTGVRDWWPDALPPLEKPIDLPPQQNQPLWLLVYVPADAAAGDYTGQLRLVAEGWSAVVPLKLHVWDFALPVRNHLETAFGLSTSNLFRYHQLKTEEQKRKVLDMYLQCFAEHRISPYDPTPLDPIRVKFLPDADPPRAELDFSAFDRQMSRAVGKYHFTNFRLPIQGMGGGTFHSRREPQLAGYGEHTPQYKAMFASYVGQLEAHLRAKGWLSMAYVYWFDEPAPKDYEFVTRGMQRLKRYAPGLQRMLTEEPNEQLQAPVDIWCPVTPNYDHQMAEKRRARGERFWWYVCTGPKAPYCTLFIDHPATELRVWLWQTWQRNIAGILVWQATYWTSSAAFPDKPQNPYEDPMGYVSGYSTPKGVKRYWGNGDGRFIYPPLSAAVPGASGNKPVLEPPVSSIRWEMLREGIEDWEMLYLLRGLVQANRHKLSADELERLEQLLQVPADITSDMTTFTTDPRPIHTHRALVARAIERLLHTRPER